MFGEAGDSKTEQWTWLQYLEETKSVAAPIKLFQELRVSGIFRLQLGAELQPCSTQAHPAHPPRLTTFFTTVAALPKAQGHIY